MSNVTVQEALKAAIEVLQRVCDSGAYIGSQDEDALKKCKSALAEIEKCQPVAYMYHVKEEKPTSVKQYTFAALDGYALQQNETLIYKEPLYTSPQHEPSKGNEKQSC